MRAYENGNVKEGVGAGAVLAAAFLKGASERTMLGLVDKTYEELLGNEP